MTSARSQLRQVSPEIFYSDGGFLAADGYIVSILKDNAQRSSRRRCRLCFHTNEDAAQQEMLIVMHRTSYVRPHRHFDKVETLTVIEGECNALLFNEEGAVTTVVSMSAPGNGGSFFYRMPEGIFHTLIFKSEWLVFIETTVGPFARTMSEAAGWAPAEDGSSRGNAYLSNLTMPL